MVFCAYCGKEFTRKEHLERHIPSHTNVKPHRCSNCHLSFARRDLLQRHHSTYHEARDLMEPLPGGVPTVAGKTPIACQNCAQAKTGCDKKVPCSRCAEKGLACAARFARRSSKAAVRAQQANIAFQGQLAQSRQLQQPQTIDPAAFLEAEQNTVKAEVVKSPPTIKAVITVDGSSQKRSPTNSLSPEQLSPPHGRIDSFNELIQMNSEFVAPDPMYQDMMMFTPDYPIDLGLYPEHMPLVRPDITMPFHDLSALSASSSEPMTATSSRGSIHTPGTSIMSTGEFDHGVKPGELSLAVPPDSSIPEYEVVIVAEGAWNLARCTPGIHTKDCPRTAIVHLECLEQKSKQEGTWSSLEKYLEQADWDAADLSSVVPLTCRTRDKMLAITQSFLHKALDIHRGGVAGYPKAGYASPGDFNFIVLPPSRVLEYFLRSYVRSLSVYFPLVEAGCVDPNDMMMQNNQASTLLVLLMIAQGAAAMPTAEARYLSAGLTETCRISLFDIVEKDVQLSADPITLRCALLFIVLGAWSGDKWLMDIAMGQRGMYMSMLKHAGMMDPQPSSIFPTFNNPSNTELQWKQWKERERQNRLVYNYVMLDQELSLFHDTAPIFAINELRCPLPAAEVLWTAPNSERWLAAVQNYYGCITNVNPQLLNSPSLAPSLCDLFKDFLHDHHNIPSRRQAPLSPQQLRLILHPIQALLFHLRQMMPCCPNYPDAMGAHRTESPTMTRGSMLSRIQEVQQLLRKWFELAMSAYKTNPNCPLTRCNMVLYHLIALNAVTNFPEIERLARRENFENPALHWELSLRHKRCIYLREEALYHAGQVFAHLRQMPKDRRPVWCSAAIYRAGLIVWVESICKLDPNFQTVHKSQQGGSPGAPVIAIDKIAVDNPLVEDYLFGHGGVEVLTRPDGSTFTLDRPEEILTYAVKEIEDGYSSRISDGIKRKITALNNNWSIDRFMGAGTGSMGGALGLEAANPER